MTPRKIIPVFVSGRVPKTGSFPTIGFGHSLSIAPARSLPGVKKAVVASKTQTLEVDKSLRCGSRPSSSHLGK